MKLTCKQCGKEFELSESEIAFYKSKNLHIPKRCEQCRQANKKNKTASAKPYENTQMQSRSYTPSGNRGSNNGKNNKLLCAILIIAIVLLTGGILLSRSYLFSRYYESTKPIYGADAYTTGDIHNQLGTESDVSNSLPASESDTANNKSETDADSVNNESGTEKSEADTAQPTASAGDVTGTNAEATQDKPTTGAESDAKQDNPATESQASAEPPQETPETDAQAAQSSGISTPQYKFRNSNLLNEHFEKHGKEMGFATAEDYQAAASAVVTNANALHKLEAEDGDDVYYIESSNDFVIVSTDGYIRTYFRPNSGIEYYNRQ